MKSTDLDLNQFIPRPQPMKRFEYRLLPGRCPRGFQAIELHNYAFRYWRDFWNSVFAEISPGETVREEDFFRQNVIGVFLDNGRIAALHLYSYFNLASEAALAQDYFKLNYSRQDLDRMKSLGIRTAMSMEYLTVDPAYRKGGTGFPMASLVLGTGYELLKSSGCDAMIAPCRCDVKVDKKVAEFGAMPLRDKFIHHGVPVLNMVAPLWNLKSHPDPLVATAVSDHWQRRMEIGFEAPARFESVITA